MKLFYKYLSLHLKTALEYKSSFVMLLLSQIIYIFIELATILAIVAKFQLLNQFNIYEILFNFSILWLGYSIAELFFRGFDMFYELISRGDFDILLIRPRSLFIQVLGSNIAYEKSGRTLVSFICFIFVLIKLIDFWTPLKVLLIIFSVIGIIIIYLSLFIIGASFSFVTIQGMEMINIFTAGSKQVGQFPMQIYHSFIRIFFTFVVPITLINYYPVNYLVGRTDNILYVFMPLLTFILFIISLLTFKLGVKKYCSTGS